MKRLLLTMVLFAAALVGCTEGDVDGSYVDSNSETINLYTSVSATRGADTTNDVIQTSNDVKLYVDATNDISDNCFAYTYSNSLWSTDADNTWANVGFPTSFYSAHDGSAQVLTVSEDGSATLDYTVSAGNTSSTKDLVYFGMEVISMPVGGNIYAYFKHALSKLNFSSTVGTANEVPHIASIKLMNVYGEATLTISNDGDTIEWSEGTVVSDYTYDSSSPLMMIPQSTTASEYVTEGYSDTYVEVIYYLTDASGNPLVGFADASKFKVGNSVIDVDNSSLDSDDPLYVKVAFPMQYDFKAATQYNIALSFDSTSSTGGYLLTDSYVDASGTAITLKDADSTPIPFPQSIGDPAITSTSTQIGLFINTIGWNETTEDLTVGLTLGQKGNPYIITTTDEFMAMADYDEGVYCQLGDNIDFTDVSDYVPFDLKANLDGDVYSVTNLTISAANDDGCLGLFGKVYGTVENVTIDSTCQMKGTGSSTDSVTAKYAGAIAGINYGTISKCVSYIGNMCVEDNATNPCYFGGIVGMMESYDGSTPKVVSCTIGKDGLEACYYFGFSGTADPYNCFGGIVGLVNSNSCTISNCNTKYLDLTFFCSNSWQEDHLLGYYHGVYIVANGYTVEVDNNTDFGENYSGYGFSYEIETYETYNEIWYKYNDLGIGGGLDVVI